MSSHGRKCSRKSVASSPYEDPRLRVFDFNEDNKDQNLSIFEASHPRMETTSSGKIGDMSGEVQNMMKNFGADINKAVVAKKQRMEACTEAACKASDQEIKVVFKTEEEQMQMLRTEHGQQFKTLFQHLDAERLEFKEQQENLTIRKHLNMSSHGRKCSRKSVASVPYEDPRLRVFDFNEDNKDQNLSTFEVSHPRMETTSSEKLGDMSDEVQNMMKNFGGTNFHRWYEELETPGNEIPEQLLADCLEPMSYERSYELPVDIAGSSHQEQHLCPQPHKQKSPIEEAHCSDQCGHCSTHKKLHTGEPVPAGPGYGKGSFQGADLYEQQYFDKGQSPRECSVCTKSCSHVKQVSVGKKKYADKEMYHCSQCGRKFMHRSSLQAHLKAHTQVKYHWCPICGKSFKWRFSMVRHQKTHTSERPFACEYCPKTYKHRSGLQTHLIIHTRENVLRGSSGRAVLRKREALVADQAAASGAEFPMNELSCTGPAEDTTP